MKKLLLLCLFLSAGLMGACGQTGGLYLPDHHAAAKIKTGEMAL